MFSNLSDLPLVELPEVFHVGSMHVDSPLTVAYE
jgi:hypothetical protein